MGGIRAPLTVACWGLGMSLLSAQVATDILLNRDGDPVVARASSSTNLASLFNEFEPRFWDVRDGMPFNRVTAIHVDNQGYLWLGSYFGIARFNGEEFVTLHDAYSTDTINSDTVCEILGDIDGKHFWIATSEGLYRSDGRTFVRRNLPEGCETILGMVRTDDGTLWLATTGGLVKVTADREIAFRGHELSDHWELQAVKRFGRDQLFVFGSPDVRVFDIQTETYHPIPWESVRTNVIETSRGGILSSDTDGSVWYQVEPKEHVDPGIWRLSPDGRTEKMVRRENAHNSDIVLLGVIGEEVWTSHEDGTVTRHTEGKTDSIRLNPRFGVTMVDTILEHNGDYWMGCEEGLVLLKRRKVRNFGSHSGLPDRFVSSMAQLNASEFVVGTGNGPAIVNKHTGRIRPITLNVNDRNVRSVAGHPEGGFWISNEHMGPLWIDESMNVHPTPVKPLWDTPEFDRKGRVTTMLYDQQQNLWVGTFSGAIKIRPDDSSVRYHIGSEPALPSNDVRVIWVDEDFGQVWMGTHGAGVAVLDGATIETHTVDHGMSGNEVFAIVPDPDGKTVWLATDQGITRYRDGKFAPLGREDGLPSGTINQILIDERNGYLWITSLKGVHRIEIDVVNDYVANRNGRLEFLTIDSADGMLNAETNGESQPAGIIDSEGDMWIPTIQGVSIILPSNFEDANEPEPPIIERIVLNDEVVYDNSVVTNRWESLTEVHVLKPGEGKIVEIKLAAPLIGLKYPVRYEYRFSSESSGQEPWRPVNGSTVIQTTLAPGDYTFQSRVATAKRIWSLASVPYRIRQLPHFYQTWYFYVLIAAAGIGAGLFLHSRRMNYASRIQQLEQNSALIAERERIARDMHDDLGSRLTHISLIAEVSDRRKEPLSEDQRRELVAASRDATRAVEEIVWAAKPENDSSENTIGYLIQRAEHLLEAANIACRNNTTNELPAAYLSPELRHGVFMAFKEALNNIVKHSGATEVWLTVLPEDNRVTIRVADNGKGFDPGTLPTGAGNGLRNMASRMTDIRGSLNIRSQPGKGTKIEITFPIPSHGSDTQFFRN